jgi:hypothetical protein
MSAITRLGLRSGTRWHSIWPSREFQWEIHMIDEYPSPKTLEGGCLGLAFSLN